MNEELLGLNKIEMIYVQHLRHCLPHSKCSWADDSHFYFPKSLASRILQGKSFTSNLKLPQMLLMSPKEFNI